MHFRLVLANKYCRSVLPWILFTITGCSLPGVVVNHERFETALTFMKLDEYPAFKVYYGGSIREVKLKDVKVLTVDPSNMLSYDNELYYSAELVMKNGSTIVSSERDNTRRTRVYVSIQNTLSGKNNGVLFKTSIGNVSRIEIYN